jgi:hypothetical protein
MAAFLVTAMSLHSIGGLGISNYTTLALSLTQHQISILENLGDEQTAELQINFKSAIINATITKSDLYYYWQIRDVTALVDIAKSFMNRSQPHLLLSINRYGIITNIFSSEPFQGITSSTVFTYNIVSL